MKTGKRKGPLAALLILVLILISAGFILPKLLDLNQYKGWITSSLEDAVQGEVTIGRIRWGISNGIWLETDEFSITPSAFPIDLNLTNIHVRLAVLPLLSKKIEISELTLDGPGVVIKLKPETRKTQKIIKSDDKAPNDEAPNDKADATPGKIPKDALGTLLPLEISVKKLSVENGQIRIEDGVTLPGQKIVHNLKAVNIKASDIIPGRTIDFLVSLEGEAATDLGTFTAEGSFEGLVNTFIIQDPKLELKGHISSLSTEIFTPYLKDSFPDLKLGGSVSLEIKYEGDLLRHYRVDGSADLTGIRYQDSSLWENVLPGGEMIIGWQASVDPREVRLGDVQIRMGNNTVNANCLIKGRDEQPVIQNIRLSSSLLLKDLVPLIPWKLIGDKTGPLKEVLLAGGSLMIDNFSLPGINLKKPVKDIETVLSKATAAIRFSDIEIHPWPDYPGFEGVSGNASLDKGVLDIAGTQVRMGPVTFPSIRLQASEFKDDFQITASLKGPIKVAGTDNKAIEKLLRENGLNRLRGAATIDMDFKYRKKQPKDWTAKGSMKFDGVNAESYPEGVHLDNLQGRLFFSRSKTTEFTVENLFASINNAPVKLSGKLTNGRTKDMVVDGKVNIKDLDLGELNSLLPSMDTLKPVGKLDLDLDFNIPFKNLEDTRVNGRLNAVGLGFHLPHYNTVVKDTNIGIGLEKETLELTNMDININDQLFHLEGRAYNPADPKIKILIQSSNLDLDRLLPKDKETADPSLQKKSDILEGDHKQGLPPWAANLTADLQIKIDEGKYHDQLFKDLNLLAHYEKGLLQNYGVNLLLANGKIITTGSADLRNPGKISFTMNPDISNVQIGELSSLFKVEKMPLDGPLSITGRIEGEAGDVKVLLSSLKGALEADVGAGRMPEVKQTGKLLTKIFSFINLNGLFSGALTKKIQNEGIPFKAIKSEVRFRKGSMNLENFIFISDSLNGNSQGVINFPDGKIGLQVVLEPLQTIDNLLEWVPILGKQAQKLTKVHLTVAGDLYNPEVRTVLTKGFTGAIMGTLGIPGAVFKKPEELSGEIDAYRKEELGENNAQ